VTRQIDEVRELAGREHNAESIRNQADATWRAAWWDLTMALADVESGDGQVKLAVEVAAEELGQSTHWLRSRRGAGQRVSLAGLATNVIRTLPPRLTVQWKGAIDAKAILAAERDGVSIRDLAREQGAQVPSWQREGERDGPTPEQRREIAHEEIARDPEIIKAVLRDQPDVEREVVRESQQRAVERMRDAGIRPNRELDHARMSTAAIAAVSHMQAVQRSLQDAVRAIRDIGLEPEDRVVLQGYHDSAEQLLRAFGQALSGDVDAELAALVAQGQS
jgi:uncharacterized protein (DUF2267 family)